MVDRRSFLKKSLLAALWISSPLPAFARISSYPEHEKSLSLYNIHTGETVRNVVFRSGEGYVAEGLSALTRLMRDYRTDEIHPIDPKLFDILFALGRKLESKEAFHVISGYRSPVTNTFLHQTTDGVAKKSLHMKGKAIDIRLPGCELPHLKKAAVSLGGGGVGFYPDSDFVHVDTGRVRYW